MAISWKTSAFPNGFKPLDDNDIAGLEKHFPRLVNWIVSCLVNRRNPSAYPNTSSQPEGLERGEPEESSDVTLTGTDESSASAGAFTFKSAEDSNVKVSVEDGKVSIGVYWT